MPSVADSIFVILLVALSYGSMATRLLGDAGTGWHIRNGEQMLHTHAISRSDTFSSTMSGQPWYAWEWLYDLVMASIHHRVGLNGVVFLTAFVIAATFALVLRLALKRGGSLPVTVVLLALSVASSTIHFFARPHVLSWLFVLVWFQILESAGPDSGRSRNRRLFWLPVLTLVWVNLHGGFLIGIALLGLYVAGNLIEYLASRNPAQRDGAVKQCRMLATMTLLSLLASLANPYGYKLHIHIYHYLSNRFLMDHIDEFLSPDFHGVAQRCFAALLLIVILAVAAAPRALRPAHVLVVLFAAYSGLYAARNIPISSILLTLVAGPLLSQAIAQAVTRQQLPARVRGFFSRLHSFAGRMGAMELRFRGHLWPVIVLALGAWICFHQGRLSSLPIMQAQFDSKRFPVEAVGVIAQQGLREPIFAPDYWGGYLIYRLYPEPKVFVDDRHDLYGEQFLKDYLKVVRIEPGWDKVLDEKRVNWVLVPTGASLANILKETPKWKVIHADGTAIFFHRKVDPES